MTGCTTHVTPHKKVNGRFLALVVERGAAAQQILWQLISNEGATRRVHDRNARFDVTFALAILKKEREIKIKKITSAQAFTPLEGLPDEVVVQELTKVPF